MGRLLLAIFALAIIAGCGGAETPWGSVSGTITQDGQPVEPALVLFSNREQGIEITAPTDSSGQFTMRTERLAGLPVGVYKVAITPLPDNLPLPEQGMMFTGPPLAPPETKIPMLDQDPATTRLKATVVAGNNQFTFELQP